MNNMDILYEIIKKKLEDYKWRSPREAKLKQKNRNEFSNTDPSMCHSINWS